MKYLRFIQKNITQKLYQNRIIILYGAKRTGKTTIANNILKEQKVKSFYLT